MKKQTTINIENDLIMKAKEQNLNLSSFIETKLLEFLNSANLKNIKANVKLALSICQVCKKKVGLSNTEVRYYDNKKVMVSCGSCLALNKWESLSQKNKDDCIKDLPDEVIIMMKESTNREYLNSWDSILKYKFKEGSGEELFSLVLRGELLLFQNHIE